MNKWDKQAFVNASIYRTKIVEGLKNGPCSPKELSKSLDLKFSHVSRALTELAEKKIVQLLTSKEIRKNKIYALKK
jgi:predicted transcriptional regulator